MIPFLRQTLDKNGESKSLSISRHTPDNDMQFHNYLKSKNLFKNILQKVKLNVSN